MSKPDKRRVKDLLSNWRHWSRDFPPDSAEILYYTISPMFRDYVKPTPKSIRYDEESAWMVERVMQEMFEWKPKEREMLILYWLYIPHQVDLADALGVSERTIRRRMGYAHDTFAHHWGLLFLED